MLDHFMANSCATSAGFRYLGVPLQDPQALTVSVSYTIGLSCFAPWHQVSAEHWKRLRGSGNQEVGSSCGRVCLSILSHFKSFRY